MANDVIADSESAATPKKGKRVLADLTGRVFERLTVIDRAPDHIQASGRKRTRWNCQCQCGKKIVASADNLINSHTKSCGCLQVETMQKCLGKKNWSFKHGYSTTVEYQCWVNAKRRTSNPKDPAYHRYGARGIGMCSSWEKGFEAFYADMGRCPDGMTLERIDNDLGYCRENCRWATKKDQARNRRTNVLIRIGNEEKLLVEWSEISGVDLSTIRARMLRSGWDNERSVFTPVKNKRRPAA